MFSRGTEVVAPSYADLDRFSCHRHSDQTLFAVLLLSDGANSAGGAPRRHDEVKEAGVPIYTIAPGTEAGTVEIPNAFGEMQPCSVPPDRETLKQIAEEPGGGRFFEAPTEADLEAVYEE